MTTTANFDRQKLSFELCRDEGFVPHVYPDSLGISSLGFGRNIDKDHGGGITMDEGLYLLGNDIERTWAAIVKALPWTVNEIDARQRALINMGFMGVEKLLGFHNMLAAWQRGDYETAANEALNSKWAYQVDDGPGRTIGRADRVAALIRNG